MKTIILINILFALSSPFFAQENKDTSIISIEHYPDVQAEFPGGSTEMMKYIAKHLTYPEYYGDIVGKIYVSFFVNTDGTVSEVKIYRGVDENLDEMVKKLILDMPRWKPAELNGKVVRSQIRLPININ